MFSLPPFRRWTTEVVQTFKCQLNLNVMFSQRTRVY